MLSNKRETSPPIWFHYCHQAGPRRVICPRRKTAALHHNIDILLSENTWTPGNGSWHNEWDRCQAVASSLSFWRSPHSRAHISLTVSVVNARGASSSPSRAEAGILIPVHFLHFVCSRNSCKTSHEERRCFKFIALGGGLNREHPHIGSTIITTSALGQSHFKFIFLYNFSRKICWMFSPTRLLMFLSFFTMNLDPFFGNFA